MSFKAGDEVVYVGPQFAGGQWEPGKKYRLRSQAPGNRDGWFVEGLYTWVEESYLKPYVTDAKTAFEQALAVYRATGAVVKVTVTETNTFDL
jgi:hypothetical protein